MITQPIMYLSDQTNADLRNFCRTCRLGPVETQIASWRPLEDRSNPTISVEAINMIDVLDFYAKLIEADYQPPSWKETYEIDLTPSHFEMIGHHHQTLALKLVEDHNIFSLYNQYRHAPSYPPLFPHIPFPRNDIEVLDRVSDLPIPDFKIRVRCHGSAVARNLGN